MRLGIQFCDTKMNNTDLDPGHIDYNPGRGEDKYVFIQCNKHQIRKNILDGYLSRLGRPTCFQEKMCGSASGGDWVNIIEEQ